MDYSNFTAEQLEALAQDNESSAKTYRAELARREHEAKKKVRVRPSRHGKSGNNRRKFYVVTSDGDYRYFYNSHTARVMAYAECMAKVAEDWLSEGIMPQGDSRFDALKWCADMIAGRESTPARIAAARAMGFID